MNETVVGLAYLSLIRQLPRSFYVLLLMSSGVQALATDPSDASIAVPNTLYVSSFATYIPLEIGSVRSWQKSNQNILSSPQIGHHMMDHMDEGMPEPPASVGKSQP